jgi:predicted CoA-substrate-specific enzyme activase
MGDRVFAGVDGGSVSIKLVLINEKGQLIQTLYRRHHGHPLETAFEILREVSKNFPEPFVSFTGTTGKTIASVLDAPHINELIALQKATERLYPEVSTVIEMGGEDSKLLILEGGAIKDFSLNSVCAAGTGSFLDQQAERLRLSIEEFAEMALRSENPPRIAGRCSVFAKSDMIHLQQIATPVEDIVAGLCFAVARNFKGTIVRGRPIPPKVAFMGGVALNKGMVRAFREVFGLDELVIPEHPEMLCAIGAVLKAKEEGLYRRLDIDRLRTSLNTQTLSDGTLRPLIGEGDDFIERHLSRKDTTFPLTEVTVKTKAYLGIDIGSISTNLAVIDEEGRLLAKRYLMTAGRPIEAVRQGLREIGAEIGDKVEIMGVGTTGSGRYMIADFVGADIVKNEITAQATAAIFIDPKVDTIFEIGGQDSKYISLREGVIVDFEMNKACAAGTGSFLEEQAEKLDISIKDEFAQYAFHSKSPCRLGERCTVFMENSLMANLQKGAKRDDLLAGLAYSIVENYINRVVSGRRIGEYIFFQGGTAFNKAVVAAFEKFLGKKITVPPHHDVTGAIGMALIARDYMKNRSGDKSRFKGFELADRPYEQSSFQCKGCENLCEINKVKIEGEKEFLFYGGRCEKYDIRRRVKSDLPDLFAFREEALWESHRQWLKKRDTSYSKRGPIGIPYVFFFHEFLPYWSTLVQELGFDLVVSPRTNRHIVTLGVETVLAESCFPVKVAHGHVRYLLEAGIKRLLIPSFVNMIQPEDPYEKGHACPYTQSFPYQVRVAFKDAEVIAPVVKLKEGDKYMYQELKRVFGPLGVKDSELKRAMQKAEEAQQDFYTKIKQKGKEFLADLNTTAVVIVGRAYNAFDMGVNLEIPKKLATLNVPSVPMDFLPDEEDIYEDWPDMYWRSGQRILKAARTIKKYKNLYPIYIGNFSCGPDSFIEKYFETELAGRPYLHIEIDEHSADAGVITRCEAFLDSIQAQIKAGKLVEKRVPLPKRINTVIKDSKNKRTIFIPHMCDHAYAIEAAFRYCGIPAEVLPESSEDALDLGRRYVSGKECFPCAVTTGDMLKKALSADFVPERSAFFMPSGTGPCRFGQYNLFQRMVLKKVGISDVPVFSPVQDVTLYKDLGIVGNDFIKRAWQGVVLYDLLLKCLHETRPYEREKGVTEELYREYVQKLRDALASQNGTIDELVSSMARDFSRIEKTDEQKPLIGIVGEIFVRSNRFSNEDLVRRLEALGAEVYLSPVDEWLYYINYMSLKKALKKRDIRATLQFLLKQFYQNRVAKRYEAPFESVIRRLHEPTTKEILRKASEYMHESFEGEAILSIGKSIDMIERGAVGIVNAMPFGCMPGTIVTAIMRGISEKYGVPCISIPFDGTASTTTQLQMEAFMEQAREKMRQLRRGY